MTGKLNNQKVKLLQNLLKHMRAHAHGYTHNTPTHLYAHKNIINRLEESLSSCPTENKPDSKVLHYAELFQVCKN
jgi:hypothetical protein